MMDWVGSGEDFCGLGWVQKFWVGLGFEKVTYDQLWSGLAYLNRHLSVMRARVVDNPYCSHCGGAYETAAHFLGECDRYASLRRDIWGKAMVIPCEFGRDLSHA